MDSSESGDWKSNYKMPVHAVFLQKSVKKPAAITGFP